MSEAIYKETDTQMQDQVPVIFTEAAAHKVHELIEEEGDPELMLRVYVMGGGCSGLRYEFMFDKNREQDDTLIEKLSAKLIIDPLSLQYLTGAEIDYKCDLEGEQFIIRNPNAKTTCGCGSSFSA